MKRRLKYLIMVLLLAMCSQLCRAVQPAGPDTIYFYDTWRQMLDKKPESMLIDPIVEVFSPYSVFFSAYSDRITGQIMTKHIAISMGDSIWLINSHYLNKYFVSDTENLIGYIPVFFNDKVAYITYHSDLSIEQVIEGLQPKDHYEMDYYYIDFMNHRVKRVTPSCLSNLLYGYNDLKMRYEGMKDYKKRDVIEDFFFKFVDRATEDILQPFIVDLAE